MATDPFAAAARRAGGGDKTSHWKVQLTVSVAAIILMLLMGATLPVIIGVILSGLLLTRVIHSTKEGVKLDRAGAALLGAIAVTAFYAVPYVGSWSQGKVNDLSGVGGPIVQGINSHGWSAPWGGGSPAPSTTTTVPGAASAAPAVQQAVARP